MARFPPLSLLPLPDHPPRVQIAALPEHVGMARDHLVDNPTYELAELRAVLALERDSEEDHQEEEIPQLFAHRLPILARDRLADLVRFLHEVGAQAPGRLLAVPGASVRTRKMADQIQKLRRGAGEFLSVGGGRRIRIRRCHLLQCTTRRVAQGPLAPPHALWYS